MDYVLAIVDVRHGTDEVADDLVEAVVAAIPVEEEPLFQIRRRFFQEGQRVTSGLAHLDRSKKKQR